MTFTLLLIAAPSAWPAMCTGDVAGLNAVTSNVTFGITPNSVRASDACFVDRSPGNSSIHSETARVDSHFAAQLPSAHSDENPWSFLAKSDTSNAGTPPDDWSLSFSVEVSQGIDDENRKTWSQGKWVLDWKDTNESADGGLPALLDLVVLVKSGNGGNDPMNSDNSGGTAGYLFRNVYLPVSEGSHSGSGGGSFQVVFTNANLKNRDISHLSVLAKKSLGISKPQAQNTVPEPGLAWLLGLGLVGMIASRSRLA